MELNVDTVLAAVNDLHARTGKRVFTLIEIAEALSGGQRVTPPGRRFGKRLLVHCSAPNRPAWLPTWLPRDPRSRSRPPGSWAAHWRPGWPKWLLRLAGCD